MKLAVLCLFVALTAGAQSITKNLPITDAEKITDALRAGPNFITDRATTVDYPAREANFEFFAWVVVAHIMVLTPHPEDLQGFTRGGRNGTYIIHLPGADQADKWFLVIPIQQADKQ
jgi:hypothetical protein